MQVPPPKMVSVAEALKSAFEHHKNRNYPRAKDIYSQILRVEPEHPHALHLLGLLSYQTGRHQEAVDLIGRAIRVRGDVPDFHTNLGVVWRVLDEHGKAAECHRRAVALEPDNPDIRINLASALAESGEEEAAGQEYREACRLANGRLEVLRYLADKLERLNQESGARQILEHALKLFPEDPQLALLDARLDRRAGRSEQGIAKLERVAAEAADMKLKAQVHFELGRLYDRVKDAGRAYRNFSDGNRLREREATASGIDRQVAMRAAEDVADILAPDWVASWQAVQEPQERPAPIFLVGFPRSGTTLLEQVLGSHSQICPVEEKPLVATMKAALEHESLPYPGGLPSLDAARVQRLRQIYFEVADVVSGAEPGQIIFDKLPLNLVNLPLIHRVFPDARVILALRHPADSILSCFMQDFQPNEAMANFYRIEDGAAFYDRVMTVWRKSVELLPIRYQTVKYENLVDDFDTEVRRLVDFIGVPWEDGLKNYQQTARKKDRIGTPSYNQVSEPIYRRAVDRWRLYEEYMEPVLPVIRPWLDYFGYPG